METGERNGLMPLLFLSQGEFLIQSGILEELQSHAARDPFRNETARRNRAIRQLIMDGEMGCVFKVLVQVKKKRCLSQ
jgi:SAM-dependent MidA family methyltransferase